MKQHKIALLSSSAEESALALSLPQLYQITLNASSWLARWGAVCIISRALVLTDYIFKWIRISFFFFLLLLSLLSLSSISKQIQMSSVLLQCPCRWQYLQANINLQSQSVEWEFG